MRFLSSFSNIFTTMLTLTFNTSNVKRENTRFDINFLQMVCEDECFILGCMCYFEEDGVVL